MERFWFTGSGWGLLLLLTLAVVLVLAVCWRTPWPRDVGWAGYLAARRERRRLRGLRRRQRLARTQLWLRRYGERARGRRLHRRVARLYGGAAPPVRLVSLRYT